MLKNFKINNELTTEKIAMIPFDIVYDVAVIGLGTAGSCALIRAASRGLKVVGVEQANCMGGVGTIGGIHTYYYGSTGGLQAELDKEVLAVSNELVGTHVQGFHPEAKKIVLETKAKDLGATLWFDSIVLAVYKEENYVIGFQVKTPQGILNIGTKFVIDCSSEGDFCVLAGAKYSYGRNYNEEAQPYSSPRTYYSQEKKKIRGANFDAGYVNTRDPFSISEAIIKGHALHVKEKFTEEDRYIYLSPLLGVREGRFIQGEDMLSFENIIFNKDVHKPVMDLYSHHDTHSNDFAFESELMQDWVVVCGLWSKDVSGGVPLGTFIPKGITGLLVAGRCMSMDHDASQSFRMQRDMQKTGEIAAVISALCIQNQVDALSVDYHQLVAELQKTGTYPKNWLHACAPQTDLAAIQKDFLELSNGFALWSCRVADRTIEPILYEWLESDHANLRNCSALVLALRGNSKSVPYLKNMVETKEPAYFKKSGKSCPFYIAAIYLLGELQDLESLELIKGFLIDTTSKTFDEITFSLFALKKIAQNPKANTVEINTFLDKAIQGISYLPLTLQGSNTKGIDDRVNRASLLKRL